MSQRNGPDIAAVYQLLTEVAWIVTGHTRRFDSVAPRFDAIEARLDAHDGRSMRMTDVSMRMTGALTSTPASSTR
jgi:hypothetical protein